MTTANDPLFGFQPDAWAEPPMTARTRFVLFVSLGLLGDQMRDDLARLGQEPISETDVIGEFPPLTFGQPKDWWAQVVKAANRLREAMRTGARWNPRTPAEEACLWVTIRVHCGAVVEMLDDAYGDAVAALPADPEDFDWEEVHERLVGDEDIASLWDIAADGIADPEDTINQQLGMGDYRPQAWHRYFERYIEEPDMESSLF